MTINPYDEVARYATACDDYDAEYCAYVAACIYEAAAARKAEEQA